MTRVIVSIVRAHGRRNPRSWLLARLTGSSTRGVRYFEDHGRRRIGAGRLRHLAYASAWKKFEADVGSHHSHQALRPYASSTGRQFWMEPKQKPSITERQTPIFPENRLSESTPKGKKKRKPSSLPCLRARICSTKGQEGWIRLVGGSGQILQRLLNELLKSRGKDRLRRRTPSIDIRDSRSS